MDMDNRPHFRTTSTGSSSTSANAPTNELFICFTSRLSSSSSMKLTKSILSPGRAARDGGPVSLSSSLSRRLRTNGSLKGGQASPFFTSNGKKRGCAFENPEPSSPKVTCIGQVRVKTKKKVKQSRSLSRRRSGEVSFRKIEQGSCGDEDKACAQPQRGGAPPQECLPHRNQRWVHLPVSICEALRAFGAEVSCLFPCKSSCFSTGEREKGEREKGLRGNENGCGAVFARWLVSVNDGEGGKRREIELVVGGGDEEERMSMRSSRRHVFEDIEVKDDRIEVKGRSMEGEEEEEEESGRVSICIPPKNALLLMRCRSDPMKMASLANRFSWDARDVSSAAENGGDDEIEEGKKDVEEQVEVIEQQDVVSVPVESIEEDDLRIPDDPGAESCSEEHVHVAETQEDELVITSEEMVEEKVEDEEKALSSAEEEEAEVESNMSSFEALLDQENAEEPYQDSHDHHQVEEHVPICHSTNSSTESEQSEEEKEEEAAMENENEATADQTGTAEDEDGEEAEAEAIPTEEPEMEKPDNLEFVTTDDDQVVQKGKGNPVLPECLLLMMCEPKLSMEVSKETWVCSTDFIRWLPERPRKSAKLPKAAGCDHEPVKRRLSIDSKPKPIPRSENNHHQPPRSSCSSMATMIEQKLVNAVGYEPFVLTRCKSEPMRSAAAKLMPDSCCWKNSIRKLEPHRRATLGVGAAGVGF